MNITSNSSNSPWIRSPLWDSFWILSPYWALVLVLILSYLTNTHNLTETIFIPIIPIISILHITLPCVFYFHTKTGQTLRASDKTWPFVVATVTILVWLLPWVFLRESLLALAAIYLAWTLWHFSAQNFGVLALYRLRSKQISRTEILVDRYYSIITTLMFTSIIWFASGSRFHVLYHLGISSDLAKPILYLIPWSSVLLATCYTIYELKKTNRNFPKLLYAISLSFQNLFIFYGNFTHWIYAYLFQLFVHHTIEIGIQSRLINTLSKSDWKKTAIGAFFWIGLFSIGTILFRIEYKKLGSNGLLDEILWASILQNPLLLFFMGIFFITTILHFYVDTRIYYFRNATVRENILTAIISKD